MLGWRLREATEVDAETVASILRAAFEEYRGQLDPPSGAHAETAETVREKMKSAGVILAFADDDDEAAGCIFCQPGEGHLYFSRLAVLPAYRRQSLGRVLIEQIEERARAMRLPRVRLGVRIALDGQRAYYERLGYHVVESASHHGYSEPTYVFMEKETSR
jgi:ribosomal protein S18 acetylase RimI-like enzyme